MTRFTCNLHDELVETLRSIRQEAELAQGEWSGVNVDDSPEWTRVFKVITIKASEVLVKATHEAL